MNMKKIAFVLAVAASLLFVSAEAMPDKKKGNEKERIDCCCEECLCRDCRCETDCSDCRGCRKHDDCRACWRDYDRDAYCCEYHRDCDKRDNRYADRDRRHHRRGGGCCGRCY